MQLTQKQAYDLSLLSNYQPYDDTKTIEDLILRLLLDKQLQNDYRNNVLFCRNFEQVKEIYPSDYRDFIIENFYDDNAVSGLVYYKIKCEDISILAIRGSEELDAIYHKTKWQDWNDNFHMFLKGPTYQQIKMLDRFYEESMQDHIFLCGHSKGGNLALFLTLACRNDEYAKINRAYAFNAPGITTSLMDSYAERIQEFDFLDKIQLYENEHDCISMFYQHLKEPFIVKSKLSNNNLEQLLHNHNLYSMCYEDGDFITSQQKSAIPKMVHLFVNDYFAKLPQKRMKLIVQRMDDYFHSDLPLPELYRVFLYHMSKYTNFFDDFSYDEITTITFRDLIAKRKSRVLLQKIKETAPKLIEVDIHQLGNVIIENYEVFIQEKAGTMQKLINRNNKMIVQKIRDFQNMKSIKFDIAKKREL